MLLTISGFYRSWMMKHSRKAEFGSSILQVASASLYDTVHIHVGTFGHKLNFGQDGHQI